MTEEDATTRAAIRTLLAFLYATICTLGTVGNCLVLSMILNVFWSSSSPPGPANSVMRRTGSHSTRHVFIYVLGLSVVDLMVLLHLPFLIVDLMLGHWPFGKIMCKIYWFGESVNKLLSAFLLSILSWDRYLAVCAPVQSIRVRSERVAVGVVVLVFLLATLLLLPVLVGAKVLYIDKRTMTVVDDAETLADLDDDDDPSDVAAKCIFNGDQDPIFVLYTFLAGFLVPALLISFFYSRVLLRLQRNSRNLRAHTWAAETRAKLVRQRASNGSSATASLATGTISGSSAAGIVSGPIPRRRPSATAHRVRQVTKRIVAVICFWFLCWTPHWALNIFAQFDLISVSWLTQVFFFCAHLLVCFNSAANPLLYALINRELRNQVASYGRVAFFHTSQDPACHRVGTTPIGGVPGDGHLARRVLGSFAQRSVETSVPRINHSGGGVRDSGGRAAEKTIAHVKHVAVNVRRSRPHPQTSTLVRVLSDWEEDDDDNVHRDALQVVEREQSRETGRPRKSVCAVRGSAHSRTLSFGECDGQTSCSVIRIPFIPS